jgi:hypothetical protein
MGNRKANIGQEISDSRGRLRSTSLSIRARNRAGTPRMRAATAGCDASQLRMRGIGVVTRDSIPGTTTACLAMRKRVFSAPTV